jgi:hypothetical protein
VSAVPILKRILAYGGVLALVIAVVGSAVGFVVAGGTGVLSALIGTAMAVVFLGIVMGAWLIKFVLFLVLVFALKGQPWIQTTVLFLSLVVAVLGTLVVDVVVIARSRLPYVSDVRLPGDAGETSSGGDQPR